MYLSLVDKENESLIKYDKQQQEQNISTIIRIFNGPICIQLSHICKIELHQTVDEKC